VTRSPNRPTGWRAFRQFRQRAARMFHRQHGNLKHGRYSKRGIAGMRMVRLCARMLRAGLWNLPVPGLTRSVPLGWVAYRAARSDRPDSLSGAVVARNVTGIEALLSVVNGREPNQTVNP
jgi:hypothetical protein